MKGIDRWTINSPLWRDIYEECVALPCLFTFKVVFSIAYTLSNWLLHTDLINFSFALVGTIGVMKLAIQDWTKSILSFEINYSILSRVWGGWQGNTLLIKSGDGLKGRYIIWQKYGNFFTMGFTSSLKSIYITNLVLLPWLQLSFAFTCITIFVRKILRWRTHYINILKFDTGHHCV